MTTTRTRVSTATPQSITTVTDDAAVAAPAGTFSVLSLILGVVSIVVGLPYVIPAAALVFGIIGAKQEPQSRGIAIAGGILGAIALFGWILVTILGVAFAGPLMLLLSM